MSDSINSAMNITWGILLFYWFVSALRTKKTSTKESFLRRFWLYWLPLIAAFYLLGPNDRFGNWLIPGNFIPHTNTVGFIGLVFCVVGLVVAVWGRAALGKNWSVSVQQKENHELIVSGAYKFIRHPIYSGLLLMLLGNAVIAGTWRGLVAVSIVLISFWFKQKKEEKWLIEIFGNEYKEYMNRTKALIPWLL
jgi:protein-S-isoprenylcysteine O-methyltransferase Ste14